LGKAQAWDPRDRYPIGGYEIDKDEYYEGTGGYLRLGRHGRTSSAATGWRNCWDPRRRMGGISQGGRIALLFINIEGGPQSAVEEGGHQPVIEGGVTLVLGGEMGLGVLAFIWSLHRILQPTACANVVGGTRLKNSVAMDGAGWSGLSGGGFLSVCSASASVSRRD